MDIKTNAKGLIDRERINRNNEKLDFTNWVYNIIKPKSGMKILDIGFGTGKQIFSIADDVLPEGEIFGVDISENALAMTNEKIHNLGLKGIKLICMDMDELPQVFKGHQFDLIYSVYAFYYSKNMLKLLFDLKDCLKNSGRILLFGFGKNSNRELIDVINKIEKNHANYYKDFLSKDELNELNSIYKINAYERFLNEIVFTQPGDLMTWLKTSELYDPKLHNQIFSSVKTRISKEGHFLLTKETIAFSLSKRKQLD